MISIERQYQNEIDELKEQRIATDSMLNLQANLIEQEIKILETHVWTCAANNLPETARQIELTRDILRAAVKLIRLETED